MAGTFRFAIRGLLLRPADEFLGPSTLSASSYKTTLPPSFLLDQLRSKVWQSAPAFSIVDLLNDRIDFVEGGVNKVATLTLGNYATGTALATQAQTAMNAVAGIVNTYSVTFNTTTRKFTFARATGSASVSFPWITGTNKDRGAGRCFGFTADDTGATSYLGDLGVRQSRHWVMIQMPASTGATVCFVSDHNLTTESGGIIRLQANSSLPFTLSGNGVEEVLDGDDTEPRHKEFTLDSNVYWRILFEDQANADGFNSAGVWFLSEFVTPTVRPSINSVETRDELSVITQAIDGAHHMDARPSRMVHTLEWLDLTEADKDLIVSIQDAHPPGSCFWINFDSEDLGDSAYGYWSDGLEISFSTPTLFNVRGTFVEALG